MKNRKSQIVNRKCNAINNLRLSLNKIPNQKMANWVKVFETKNMFKAEFLKNELLSHEIMAVILNKKETVYQLGYYEIQVSDEQESIAKVVIDLFNQNDPETESTI